VNAVVALSILVLMLALAVVAGLVVVVAGIRGDERRMSLCEAPRTRAGSVARRVPGAYATPDHTVDRAHADARR
jgi:hypothetical protein